ncbi:MAG TPA: RnfABCDGE type electron transport complex subunit B [bacterium]|nr:RnfABCDGE type electron transport complex subunit B [bacterium]HPJ72008.1 RnfABCDGE type electron transport complex subunit B [bacterium]HPQ65459.1 RnfABCDGE type electron transport complex subunit B [bacterium]
MTPLLATIFTLAGLGLVFGAALGLGSRFFRVRTDPRLDIVNDLLPGANCGACGFSGCLACARALIDNRIEVGVCPVCSAENTDRIAQVLGRAPEKKAPKTARIFCRGGHDVSLRYQYRGVQNCFAANQFGGGVSACDYGCLRYYSCLDICPFQAIYIDSHRNPVIDESKCVACGLCVKVCPRHLIRLVPVAAVVDIRCSSRNPAREVSRVCLVGCIACGKCVRECPVGAITIEDNLARIDYELCIKCGKCIEVCPRKIIEHSGKVKRDG